MLDKVQDVIQDISEGKIVIVIDAEDRENEGDFICAAELATPENVNFMATYGRGLICCSISSKQAMNLNLSYMVSESSCPLGTAFTVSVDAKKNMTTGISVYERAATINLLANKNAIAKDFVSPGHIFPLIANDKGLLGRLGHTEAGVELSSMADLNPSAVICEILNTDGSLARLSDLLNIAKKHKLKITSIEDIIAYIKEND